VFKNAKWSANCKHNYFDGQHFYLSIERYFSVMLSLPVELLHESLIWNAAHHLEFVHDDVTHGKMTKRTNRATLLQLLLHGFRNLIQAALRSPKCNTHHWRGISRILSLFRDKIFWIQPRTYDHFVKMYHILYEKINRGEKENQSVNLETLETKLI